MINNDYHVHTAFSTDSETPLEDQIRQLITMGMDRICITDHEDLYFPHLPDDYPGILFPFNLDLPDYVQTIQEAREMYCGRIDVRMGIELGLVTRARREYHQILDTYAFDFVLGSIHNIDDADPYYPAFWEGRSVRQTMQYYFSTMLTQITAFSDFDALSHLDYICRYAPGGAAMHWRYEDFHEIIDEILRFLIRHDKALEVNTSGYKYGLGVPNPQPQVLSRYRELGGELITIGSDGHKPEHLAYAFDQCEALLKSLGFTSYAVYEGRKPVEIGL